MEIDNNNGDFEEKFELLVMKCYTITHKECCWLDRFRFFNWDLSASEWILGRD
jgi:hypothetical protein